MKTLRFVALCIALLLAWLSIYLLQTLSFTGILPDWLVARFPQLALPARWLPGDLLTMGLWLGLIAALLFGLAAPPWQVSTRRQVASGPAASPPSAFRLPFEPAMLFVALAAGFLLIARPLLNISGMLTTVIWLAVAALLFLVAAQVESRRTVHIVTEDEPQPEASWRLLVPILLLAALLFAWRNQTLPDTLPTLAASIGVQAQAGGSVFSSGLFALGSAGLPRLSTLFTSLGVSLFTNPFAGLAWPALIAGLAVVLFTWLLAIELFRRQPRHDQLGATEEDDGRSSALIAALAVAVLLPLNYYSRLPLMLEVVAWGTAALWLLLRAARLGSLRTAVWSGLCVGVSATLWASGLIFVAAAGVVWLALIVMQRGRLSALLGGLGREGALLWLLAAGAGASTTLCVWVCGPETIFGGVVTGAAFRHGILTALSSFGLSFDLVPASPDMLAVFSLLIAPLFLLALGVLLFHLDTVIGWLLIGWFTVAIVAAAPSSAGGVSDWPVLLPALPAVALALAFGLDRVRATLDATVGEWSAPSFTILAAGVLLLAGLQSWRALPRVTVTEPPATAATSISSSALARAVAAAPDEAPLALVIDNRTPLAWESPHLRFATHGHSGPLLTLTASDPSAWPQAPAGGTHLFLLPDQSSVVQLLRGRYPGGILSVERDIRANPLLYVYSLP